MPLMAAHPLALAQLPSGAGLYRIRQAMVPARLEWIGWDARGIRDVIERLSRQVHLPVEPFDDPSVPARRLWSLRHHEGKSFEVSGAETVISAEDGAAAVLLLRKEYEEMILGRAENIFNI